MATKDTLSNDNHSDLAQIKQNLGEGAQPEVTVKSGDTARIQSVFCDLQNPYTLDTFQVGSSKKVVVDDWIELQLKGGKLMVEAD
jgi:hypothetical protein